MDEVISHLPKLTDNPHHRSAYWMPEEIEEIRRKCLISVEGHKIYDDSWDPSIIYMPLFYCNENVEPNWDCYERPLAWHAAIRKATIDCFWDCVDAVCHRIVETLIMGGEDLTLKSCKPIKLRPLISNSFRWPRTQHTVKRPLVLSSSLPGSIDLRTISMSLADTDLLETTPPIFESTPLASPLVGTPRSPRELSPPRSALPLIRIVEQSIDQFFTPDESLN